MTIGNLKLLEALLRSHEYEVIKASNGEEALSVLRQAILT